MFLDLRLAVRSIVRAPLTAVGAILTLAVSVGVTLTALGTLDGFFWRPPPYRGVDRLVGIARADPPLSLRWPEADIGTIEMVRARMPALDDVAAASEQGVRVELASGTVVRQATWTTPNAFAMLGTPPLIGRVPHAARGGVGAGEVAVSAQFWRQYLGARPDVIGATLVVDGAIATIVGVMPDGFQFHFNSDLWLALDWSALHYTPEERLITIGRLRQGATLREARLQAAALTPQLPTYQGYESRYTLFVHDEMIIRNAIPKPLFRLVLGVALFVLVVGCVNVREPSTRAHPHPPGGTRHSGGT